MLNFNYMVKCRGIIQLFIAGKVSTSEQKGKHIPLASLPLINTVTMALHKTPEVYLSESTASCGHADNKIDNETSWEAWSLSAISCLNNDLRPSDVVASSSDIWVQKCRNLMSLTTFFKGRDVPTKICNTFTSIQEQFWSHMGISASWTEACWVQVPRRNHWHMAGPYPISG